MNSEFCTTNETEQKTGNYYITQDTRKIAQRLCQSIYRGDLPPEAKKDIDVIADIFWSRKVNILTNEFPNVIAITEEQMEKQLADIFTAELQTNSNLYPVSLDRFLPDCDAITRFGIARMADGSKQPRQGSNSMSSQLEAVKQNTQGRDVLLIDDGVFSGGTMREAVSLFRSRGIKVSKILVLLADGVTEIEGVAVQSVNQFSDLIDWNDSRDLTQFGGKPQKLSRNLRVATSKPYIAPYSDGSGMSLDKSPTFYETSIALLEAEQDFIQQLECIIGRKVTLKDVIRAGFPIPVNECMPRSNLSTPITVINELARNLIKARELEIPQYVVLDMDGTLYNLDGDNGAFKGSRLEKAVLKNALWYIKFMERCSIEEANDILSQALQDEVGISNVLAKRYGITREEYFEVVWGAICIEQVLDSKNLEESREVLEGLLKNGKDLILLTSAPNVWARKVVENLGLQDRFSQLITGEEFKLKDEAFERLSELYGGSNIISVGDQFQTDILPAQQRGMKTFQVSSINPLSYLLLSKL